MRRFKFFGALSVFAVCSAVFSSAEAQTLVSFDFENFSVGQVVGDASFVASGLTVSFDMANNGVEDGNGYARSYTRFVGSVNYARLNFSTTVPFSLDRIDFDHQHNHNPGFPTHLGYGVDLLIQNPVPGPLPLMGAGMGYAFSRRLRRRIRSLWAEPVSGNSLPRCSKTAVMVVSSAAML
ncbi:MAG: hypothetical protein ACK6BG_01425 [Cyanobacteriota bacterium]